MEKLSEKTSFKKKYLFIVFSVVVFLCLSVNVYNAFSIEIKFTGQIKNRGTLRDISWWNNKLIYSRRGIYSNFWDSNLSVFRISRQNWYQNNPLSSMQSYNDQFEAGRNVYGNNPPLFFRAPATEKQHGSVSWLDTRALLGMQTVINENLKGVFLFQFGQYDWGSYATQPGTNNDSFLVNNAYVEFKKDLTYLENFSCVVGLAPLKIGHGVLLQDDVAMLATAFDILSSRLTLFSAVASEGYRVKNDDDDYYGGKLAFDLDDKGYIEVFGVWRKTLRSFLFIPGKTYSDLSMAYIGVSGDLKLKPVSVSFEGIWQNGRLKSYFDEIKINSFMGYLDVSADTGIAKVGVSGLYAMGNKGDYELDLSRRDINMFYGISPVDSYDRCVLDWDELFVREILTNNVSNILSPKIHATFDFNDIISVTLQNQWYWKDKTPVGNGAYRNSFIGKNIDIIANIHIYENLNWRLTASHMWTSDDVFGPSSDNLWQLRQDLTYTF